MTPNPNPTTPDAPNKIHWRKGKPRKAAPTPPARELDGPLPRSTVPRRLLRVEKNFQTGRQEVIAMYSDEQPVDRFHPGGRLENRVKNLVLDKTRNPESEAKPGNRNRRRNRRGWRRRHLDLLNGMFRAYAAAGTAGETEAGDTPAA